MTHLIKAAASAHALAIALFLAPAVHAQTPAAPDSAAAAFGWNRQFSGLLNLNQSYYENWAKGGTDALAYEWNFKGSAVLEEKDFIWESKAKAVYGRTNRICSTPPTSRKPSAWASHPSRT